MALQSELNLQTTASSFGPWVDPNVTAQFFPQDFGDPEAGGSNAVSEERAWPPANPKATAPGLSEIAWEFDDRLASKWPYRGWSWFTKFEPNLSDALGDLREVRKEASEKEFRRPSDSALANAERILKEMYQIRRIRYEVYPLEDGEVAIDAPGERSTSVFVACEADGSALCIINSGGKDQLQRYTAATDLPDDFLSRGLRSLVAIREISR